jgi:hypothetical protein
MNTLLLALCLVSAEFGHGLGGHGHGGHGHGGHGHGGHGHHGGRGDCPNCAPGDDGEMSFTLINKNDPCYRGTMFPALKIVRAYRDNEAFAYHHFEDKRLQVSGRLVSIKKRLAVPYVEIDPITKKAIRDVDGRYSLIERDVFVALVTPDGKFPAAPITPTGEIKEMIGLEFRFPIDTLRDKPAARCNISALWAGQFVTLKGDCRGAYPSPDGYTAVIFENAEIVP